MYEGDQWPQGTTGVQEASETWQRQEKNEGTKQGCGHYIKVLLIPKATPMLRSLMAIDPEDSDSSGCLQNRRDLHARKVALDSIQAAAWHRRDDVCGRKYLAFHTANGIPQDHSDCSAYGDHRLGIYGNASWRETRVVKLCQRGCTDIHTSICTSASASPMPDNSSHAPSPTPASKTGLTYLFRAVPTAASTLTTLPHSTGYRSEVTRTLALLAFTIPDTHLQIWNFAHSAQNIAFQTVYAGVVAEHVDDAPRLFLGLAGYAKYFTHRLGHDIGPEVHEDPYLNSGSEVILQIGHTLSDEPGVYIEGKVGARLEECFYIVQNGNEVYLTARVGGPASSPWKP
ncbi:Creatinase/aminopeptidase [Armillaria gallica]|uniref:Creatinase/aminopeptidase n=1 Tax=Armillaria gallica TaxID=47427 RepID=A0A2H3D7U0_ARMGA|nr:Creatinase/aminopeptidase [Armillaria gallica]